MRISALRRVGWILAALLGCTLTGAPEPGSDAEARSGGQAGRLEASAKRHVRRHMPATLRSNPTVACRRVAGVRARRRARHTCRWKGEQRLSPNRHRVCHDRWRLERPRRRWRVTARSKLRCVHELKPVDPGLGFNDNSVPLGQLSAAASAELNERVGVGLNRVTLDWRGVERSRNHYDFSVYDGLYRELLARGIRPVWVLAFAPVWARDSLVLCGAPACLMPPARHELNEWAQIAGLVASRYPQAAAIEVWNEPNESTFWQSGVDPGRYTELLRTAHGAIKAANPRMPVVSAGLSDRAIRSLAGDLPLDEFLASMLAAGGGQSLDAIGVHIYPRRAGFPWLQRTLSRVRELRSGGAARGKPIWVTETGLSTEPSPLGGSVDEAEQASGLLRMYRAYRSEPDLDAWIFHTLLEPPRSPPSGFALLRSQFSPKAAFCAFAQELRTGARCSP